MANYEGTWRSNYFRVKDVAAFKKAIAYIAGVKVLEDRPAYGAQSPGPYVVLLPDDSSDSQDFPEIYLEEESDEPQDIDWHSIFEEHLQEDSIVVIMCCGHEKLSCLYGTAVAYDHSGRNISLDLNHIYRMIEERWGAGYFEVTRCEY